VTHARIVGPRRAIEIDQKSIVFVGVDPALGMPRPVMPLRYAESASPIH